MRKGGLLWDTKERSLFFSVFLKPESVEGLKENNRGGICLEEGGGFFWWCDTIYFPEVTS